MNQLTTDLDYIHSISHKLRNFKKKKDYLYNFSCPVCGDSSKKKTKARGYFFRVKDMMLYRCHNCGLLMQNPINAISWHDTVTAKRSIQCTIPYSIHLLK